MTTAQVSEPEDRVLLSPSDRYAIVGKTGCGKTTFTSYLAGTIVPKPLQDADWQVWWFDTKGDPRDIARLQKLGYVEGDPVTGKAKQKQSFWKNERPPALMYFRVRDRGEGLSIVDQVQHLYRLALARRRVLCVADEFAQVVVGPRTAGRAMDDVLTRGRGLGVGNIGETQEPVDIPRKLLSQPQHLFVFDLSFPRDIKYIREMLPDYDRPSREERHAFIHLWIDGDAQPRYYPSLRAWWSRVIEGTA
jgi:energy-coupling factor transporter ATP-binding protein EcfA2